MYSFGQRLKKVRNKRNLTQSELSKRCGITESSVAHFENDSRKPSMDNLYKLVCALEVNSDYLLGRVEDILFIEKKSESKNNIYEYLEQLTSEDMDLAKKIISILAERNIHQ